MNYLTLFIFITFKQYLYSPVLYFVITINTTLIARYTIYNSIISIYIFIYIFGLIINIIPLSLGIIYNLYTLAILYYTLLSFIYSHTHYQ